MYSMSRNEAFAAVVITLASVAVYSFWGAHLISQEAGKSPQAVAASR